MDLVRLGKELEGIPTEVLEKLQEWISNRVRLERAMTGNILSANEIARMFGIERTQRAVDKAVVTGEGTGEIKGFLDTPTIPKQVTGE